jgi:cytochrome c2
MRATALLALVLLGVSTACTDTQDAEAREAIAMTGGDPARGRVIVTKYGCQTCHAIPGVEGADARVGPPLGGVADRSYIAGVLTNTPGNMVKWILDPPAVDSLTAMPNVGVTPADARHIAAYLYTLR